MTTLTVEIEKAEDLEAVKNLFSERGLFYEEGENSYQDFVLTDEMKRELDKRDADYLSGKDVPLTSEESERRIDAILNRKNSNVFQLPHLKRCTDGL